MLIWNPSATPEELHLLLETLADEYPVKKSGTGTTLEFVKGAPGTLEVSFPDAGICRIVYGSLREAARGVGHALGGSSANEKMDFKTFGILFDVSRAPVMTVEHFKFWLRRMALTGYNLAMLYTKDTYTLPGEPYFGYMRGRYSTEEIKELDLYAQKLGIEMIAAIQALGHLEPVLRWSAYFKVKDTDNVLMVDEPESYKLIDKMLEFWSTALSSRRIHLGMDETHDLGRGRFYDFNGDERNFDIYNRHLGRVNDLCKKYDLKPIIWSDMYFRFANPQRNYYDLKTVVPADVAEKIPADVTLSYWDYYHDDPDFYKTFLEKHQAIGKQPVMASGIWTWPRLWYSQIRTERNAGAAMEGSRKAGVDELFFALWADDGGYCEFDSAFTGLAWAADYAANQGNVEPQRLRKLYAGVFGTDYDAQLLPCALDELNLESEDYRMHYELLASMMLWDDPLMGIMEKEYRFYDPQIWEKTLKRWKDLAGKLPQQENRRAAGDLDYIRDVTELLIAKVETRLALRESYRTKDHAALLTVAERAEKEIPEKIQQVLDSYRRQWFRSYKTYGLEVMQIRLSGVRERFIETARQIREYVAGSRKSLPELEPGDDIPVIGITENRYRMCATGGWFI